MQNRLQQDMPHAFEVTQTCHDGTNVTSGFSEATLLASTTDCCTPIHPHNWWIVRNFLRWHPQCSMGTSHPHSHQLRSAVFQAKSPHSFCILHTRILPWVSRLWTPTPHSLWLPFRRLPTQKAANTSLTLVLCRLCTHTTLYEHTLAQR